MSFSRKTLYFSFLFSITSLFSNAQSLEKKFDQMLNEKFVSIEPGATALVAIGGKIVYHKAFGMANMELAVPMKTDMKFEIGSITKQFTAVAILMLKEQGKLNLEDDITKYIENYPTHGHKITIHHLLTHTSGITNYTSLESWAHVWRKDLTTKELIDVFKNAPMDFAPGEKWNYSNSGYILLGAIIEKASGQTYGKFIETNIFEPLGMKSSLYGSNSEIIPNRAYGYQKQEKIVNAEYLSLTQPYAAGSLISTVGDLFIWNRAIRSNKLVKKESIELAFTNYTLNNKDKISYGYGWAIYDINGSRTIEHSGGIFGFETNSIYLPEEDVFVVVFTNSDYNSPAMISTKMAAMAIGKPFPEVKDKLSVKSEDLQKFTGVYEFSDSSMRQITLEEGQLYSQRLGGEKFKIFPGKENSFFYEDDLALLQFKENGGETELLFSSRNGKINGKKTTKIFPVRQEVQIGEDILKKYTGVFELTPNFSLEVTLENGKLMTQATGQDKTEIFAESETKFFLKAVDAQIEFIKNNCGAFDSLILYQGGQEVPAKKKG